MASGYPINLGGVKILSSEALYQALRYPDFPEIQQIIIGQKSPMTAKMISKKYRENCRTDWDKVRLIIMRWCIRVKLVQNWEKFGSLLLSTNSKTIVEVSHKDYYWGAVPSDVNLLIGTNALGRLLMELRDELPKFIDSNELNSLNIENFSLYGKKIMPVQFQINTMPHVVKDYTQVKYKNLSLFDNLLNSPSSFEED